MLLPPLPSVLPAGPAGPAGPARAARRPVLLRALAPLVAAAVPVAALLLPAAPARAAAGDVGTPGPSYSGVTHPPTSEKQQSKLWWDGGAWWAVMWVTGSGWHLERLDREAGSWVDTGVLVDARADTLVDVLFDGDHLFVAVHVATTSTSSAPNPSRDGAPARLYRYTRTAGTYALDAGFPTTITTSSSESLTIDEDSTGALWATWVRVEPTGGADQATVQVASSAPGGTGWSTPTALPVDDPHPSADDTASVVAFGGSRVGVMWSDQLTGRVGWAVHADGAPASQWSSGTAFDGSSAADDHIDLKSLQADDAGRVVAAVKTGFDLVSGNGGAPQVVLLVSTPGGGFTSTPVSTVADCQTRPQVVLDGAGLVHVFSTGPQTSTSGCPYAGAPGAVYEKTTSLDAPSFPAGRGTPVLQVAAGAVNDATTSKQPATRASGLVVLASDETTHRYWYADEAVGGGGADGSSLPDRTAGDDRFATAAQVSREAFEDGASTAVVASGADFPDALAAAPLAHALGAPVLLVEPRALPAATAAELSRLGARRVVLVGGTTAVSAGVEDALRARVGSVQRIAGDDRYGTAERVAAAVVEAAGPRRPVVLASGEAFPDAVAGGAAAAGVDGVVLLTRRDDLPAETARALSATAPRTLSVVGGTAAVSAAVQAQAAARTSGTVRRLAGADRFGTAAAVAAQAAVAPPVALLASGAAFPDALTGAALGVPLLLTEPTCRPAATAAQLRALGDPRTAALGGPAALSEAARTGSRTC